MARLLSWKANSNLNMGWGYNPHYCEVSMRYQRMKRLLAYNDTTLARISRKYGIRYGVFYKWATQNKATKTNRLHFEKIMQNEIGYKETNNA